MYYMVDLAVWVEEFLYVLFDHLDMIEEKELSRDVTMIDKSEKENNYYELIKNKSGIAAVDKAVSNVTQTVAANAMGALGKMNIKPVKNISSDPEIDRKDTMDKLEENLEDPEEIKVSGFNLSNSEQDSDPITKTI